MKTRKERHAAYMALWQLLTQLRPAPRSLTHAWMRLLPITELRQWLRLYELEYLCYRSKLSQARVARIKAFLFDHDQMRSREQQ